MLSSLVSTSISRPLCDQWNQYSSIGPRQASSRSAMSRAPEVVCPSFSGSTQPSAETPVRITSIGCAAAGIDFSTSCTASGRPRSSRSLVL